MRWIVRGYTLILLAYTGWRTYDFMINQLPAGDFSFWLALLFLFATEVGLAMWHEVSISHTSTYTQHYIATALTWLDFVGSLGAGIADMIIRQTFIDGYQVPALLATGLIFGLPIVVAINIAGSLVFLANDAEIQLDRERRFIEFEASRQALRSVGTNRRVIAARKRDELYELLAENASNLPAKLPVKIDEPNGQDLEEAQMLANPTRRRSSRKLQS